jgi:hypothetical protein
VAVHWQQDVAEFVCHHRRQGTFRDAAARHDVRQDPWEIDVRASAVAGGAPEHVRVGFETIRHPGIEYQHIDAQVFVGTDRVLRRL